MREIARERLARETDLQDKELKQAEGARTTVSGRVRYAGGVGRGWKQFSSLHDSNK